MDGLVVCAMAGARRGRGFEPRFVCPSRGPLVRPPPPPPSASRSTTGTAGATGGVSRPHSFFSLRYVTDQCQLYLRVQQKGIRHYTRAAARSTTGAALRRRNRISSSYSPLARLLRGIRTPIFSAAAGCTAAGVLAAKPCFSPTIHRNEVSRQNIKIRGWASGPLTPTTQYSHTQCLQHHDTTTTIEHTDTRQNTP